VAAPATSVANLGEWLSGTHTLAEWVSGCGSVSHSGRVAEWLSGWVSHSGRVAEWLLQPLWQSG